MPPELTRRIVEPLWFQMLPVAGEARKVFGLQSAAPTAARFLLICRRVDVTIEPEDTNCPCCRAPMQVIGEETYQRLDVVPARFRVIVTHRPKYACRACTQGVVQAPAPERLIKGGLPTEAMVASVLVAKYAWHLPLYRQAQMLLAQGLDIKRATLAFWVGYAAAELMPVYLRLRELILSACSPLAAWPLVHQRPAFSAPTRASPPGLPGLDLDPGPHPARSVGRIAPFRDDALAASLQAPSASICSLSSDLAGDRREQLGEPRLALRMIANAPPAARRRARCFRTGSTRPFSMASASPPSWSICCIISCCRRIAWPN